MHNNVSQHGFHENEMFINYFAKLYFYIENIGCSRTGDNRWITQYETLFCVLNSKGQVVTWRLTPRLTFSEVEFDLIALKNRFDLHGKVLKEFYIDNCCSWRKKLQQIFGNELIVYLDLFHAVKRFSDKIPKGIHYERNALGSGRWFLGIQVIKEKYVICLHHLH